MNIRMITIYSYRFNKGQLKFLSLQVEEYNSRNIVTITVKISILVQIYQRIIIIPYLKKKKKIIVTNIRKLLFETVMKMTLKI